MRRNLFAPQRREDGKNFGAGVLYACKCESPLFLDRESGVRSEGAAGVRSGICASERDETADGSSERGPEHSGGLGRQGRLREAKARNNRNLAPLRAQDV